MNTQKLYEVHNGNLTPLRYDTAEIVDFANSQIGREVKEAYQRLKAETAPPWTSPKALGGDGWRVEDAGRIGSILIWKVRVEA